MDSGLFAVASILATNAGKCAQFRCPHLFLENRMNKGFARNYLKKEANSSPFHLAIFDFHLCPK